MAQLRFPKVTVQYGEPMSFAAVSEPSREQQLEVAGQIFERVQECTRHSTRRVAGA